MVFYKIISIYILDKPRKRVRVRIKAYKAVKIDIKILYLVGAFLISFFLLVKEKL